MCVCSFRALSLQIDAPSESRIQLDLQLTHLFPNCAKLLFHGCDILIYLLGGRCEQILNLRQWQ